MHAWNNLLLPSFKPSKTEGVGNNQCAVPSAQVYSTSTLTGFRIQRLPYAHYDLIYVEPQLHPNINYVESIRNVYYIYIYDTVLDG